MTSACVDDATRLGLEDEFVCVSQEKDEWGALLPALREAWQRKGSAA